MSAYAFQKRIAPKVPADRIAGAAFDPVGVVLYVPVLIPIQERVVNCAERRAKRFLPRRCRNQREIVAPAVFMAAAKFQIFGGIRHALRQRLDRAAIFAPKWA